MGTYGARNSARILFPKLERRRWVGVGRGRLLDPRRTIPTRSLGRLFPPSGAVPLGRPPVGSWWVLQFGLCGAARATIRSLGLGLLLRPSLVSRSRSGVLLLWGTSWALHEGILRAGDPPLSGGDGRESGKPTDPRGLRTPWPTPRRRRRRRPLAMMERVSRSLCLVPLLQRCRRRGQGPGREEHDGRACARGDGQVQGLRRREGQGAGAEDQLQDHRRRTVIQNLLAGSNFFQYHLLVTLLTFLLSPSRT